MSKAIFFNSYKLKKGVAIPEFLAIAEQLNKEHISKQSGYISSSLLVDGEIWADQTIFETLKDLEAFIQTSASSKNELAEKFYSCININSCVTRCFVVEKNF